MYGATQQRHNETMSFNNNNNNTTRCDARTQQKRLRSKRLQYVSGAILMAWPLHITSIEHNGLYTSESYILHMGCAVRTFSYIFLLCLLFLCRHHLPRTFIQWRYALHLIFTPFLLPILSSLHFRSLLLSLTVCVCATPCIHQMDTRTQKHTLSYE